jgi:phosphoglycolate phosphatase-like HAD superfamily hydrolase
MDLDTARRAGMNSIAVTWGYHDRVRLSAADNIAEDISQLASLLEFTEPSMEGRIDNPPQPMK